MRAWQEWIAAARVKNVAAAALEPSPELIGGLQHTRPDPIWLTQPTRPDLSAGPVIGDCLH